MLYMCQVAATVSTGQITAQSCVGQTLGLHTILVQLGVWEPEGPGLYGVSVGSK